MSVEKIAQAAGSVKNIAIGVAVLAGVVAVAYVGFKLYRGAQAVGETAGQVIDWGRDVANKDLNPTSDQNLIYRGVNAAGGAIAGSEDWSLGAWLYDVTH